MNIKRFTLILALLLGSCNNRPPVVIPPTPTPIPTPIPVPEVRLPRLVPVGSYFRLDTGERFTGIAVTDFQLYKKYLDGENIEEILADRAGFNTHRVFLIAKNLFELNPRLYSNYYEGIKPFCKLLAKHGRYVEFVAFADGPLVFNSDDEKRSYWERIILELQGETNVLLELVNENTQSANVIDLNLFNKPDGILSSHGSNSSQEEPIRPWWDYETFHTNDAYEWWRKVGHNAMEFSHGADGIPASHSPISSNENTRFPDKDHSEEHAFDASAAAALLIASSTFHCDNCRWSRLFSDDERRLANAWIAGSQSVPLACQLEEYRHRDDIENNEDPSGKNLLRVYQNGSDDNCIVRVRGARR